MELWFEQKLTNNSDNNNSKNTWPEAKVNICSFEKNLFTQQIV